MKSAICLSFLDLLDVVDSDAVLVDLRDLASDRHRLTGGEAALLGGGPPADLRAVAREEVDRASGAALVAPALSVSRDDHADLDRLPHCHVLAGHLRSHQASALRVLLVAAVALREVAGAADLLAADRVHRGDDRHGVSEVISADDRLPVVQDRLGPLVGALGHILDRGADLVAVHVTGEEVVHDRLLRAVRIGALLVSPLPDHEIRSLHEILDQDGRAGAADLLVSLRIRRVLRPVQDGSSVAGVDRAVVQEAGGADLLALPVALHDERDQAAAVLVAVVAVRMGVRVLHEGGVTEAVQQVALGHVIDHARDRPAAVRQGRALDLHNRLDVEDAARIVLVSHVAADVVNDEARSDFLATRAGDAAGDLVEDLDQSVEAIDVHEEVSPLGKAEDGLGLSDLEGRGVDLDAVHVLRIPDLPSVRKVSVRILSRYLRVFRSGS